MRFLALGEFNLSRNFLRLLAGRGHQVHYGYLKKPELPEPSPMLHTVRIPPRERRAWVDDAVATFRPDVLYVGSAGYDGSNALADELVTDRPGVPIVRVYKEFAIGADEREDRVLNGVDGLVLHSPTVTDYFRALYGLRGQAVHVFDHDRVADHLVPDHLPDEPLSAVDGEPHVVLGGTMKADGSCYDYREFVEALADERVHVHVYTAAFSRWLSPGRVLDPDSAEVRAAYEPLWRHPYVHREDPVPQAEQVVTWSRFDAGLMQVRPTRYEATVTAWQHMDHPSKHSYYLAAGLPVAIDRRVLTSLQDHLAPHGVVLDHESAPELAARLRDREGLALARAAARSRRHDVVLSAGLDDLIAFVDGVRERHGLVPEVSLT